MDAQVTGYDPDLKFYATRYRQGGRMVYSMDLSLAQVASLLPAPDPDVIMPGNRAITPSHAQAFGDYLRNRSDWVSPSLLLRGPTMFDFTLMDTVPVDGPEFGIVAFPRLSMGDLRIIDGQHRVLGIHKAVQDMSNDLDKMRSALVSARKSDALEAVLVNLKGQVDAIVRKRHMFDNERISVQIVVVEDQAEYMQMFADIADHAKGISGSVLVTFDTTQVVNRALPAVMFHPLISGKVDTQRDVLGRSNPNFLSAKHVADLIRISTVGLDGRMNKRLESELHESELAARANQFFDVILGTFPQLAEMASGELVPTLLRSQSMLGSPVTLRVLAGVMFDLKAQGWENTRIEKFFAELEPFLSKPATREWVKAVGSDLFVVGGLAPTSRRQDLKAYKAALVGWALEGVPDMEPAKRAPRRAKAA